MSQESRYTIIQRDQYGTAVNTITSLDERAANTMAAVLRTGDAYTGERPWTVDIERELTEAEKLAQRVEAWLADHATLETTVELAAALELLAERLRSLGEQPLGQVWLTVDVQIASRVGDEPVRRAAVDLLASVAGVAAEEKAHGSYSSYSAHGKPPWRVFTPIEKPMPQAEPVEAPVLAEGVDAPAELLERHIADPDGENTETVDTPAELASGGIPAERVDELVRTLNEMTEARADWWKWIEQQPEFDRAATEASADTAELHLSDGTVLRWATDTSWTRAAVA